MTTVIAERALDYFGGKGIAAGSIRVFAPQPRKDDWKCRYRISWPDYDRRQQMYGVDAYQALSSTLQIIPVEIAASEAFKAGRIGVFGRRLTSIADLKLMFDLKHLIGFDP